MWAGLNVMLAAGRVREAAVLTTQISGELVPSDVPGSLSCASSTSTACSSSSAA